MLKDYEEVDDWFTEYLVNQFYDPNNKEGALNEQGIMKPREWWEQQ